MKGNHINYRYLNLLTIVAAMGGLLFGFDIAIITGANPFLELHGHLDEKQLGLGTSALLFGCIPGAITAGRMTDIFGRRKIIRRNIKILEVNTKGLIIFYL